MTLPTNISFLETKVLDFTRSDRNNKSNPSGRPDTKPIADGIADSPFLSTDFILLRGPNKTDPPVEWTCFRYFHQHKPHSSHNHQWIRHQSSYAPIIHFSHCLIVSLKIKIYLTPIVTNQSYKNV